MVVLFICGLGKMMVMGTCIRSKLHLENILHTTNRYKIMCMCYGILHLVQRLIIKGHLRAIQVAINKPHNTYKDVMQQQPIMRQV